MNATHLLRTLRAAAVASFLCAVAGPAVHAEISGYPPSVEDYDAREVAMLPRYCKYTQLFRQHVPGGDNKAEIDRWHAQMGEAFQAMHHYCWGLMKTNRAMLLAKTRQDRQFYLDSSINEFDYVIQNSQPGFVLLPEIYTRKGENQLRLGRSALGVQTLERAIALKPDYWPPYAKLSDYYKASGNAGKARETLEKGLAQIPDAKALNRRLAELKDVKAKQ